MSDNQKFYLFGEKVMIKKILLIIKENGLIVLGAAILASGIFYVVKSPDIFMASVLSLQEKTFVAEK